MKVRQCSMQDEGLVCVRSKAQAGVLALGLAMQLGGEGALGEDSVAAESVGLQLRVLCA